MTDELEPDIFDPNDPIEAEQHRQKTAERIRKRKLAIVAAIMSSEDGRMWMDDLLGNECHLFAENAMHDTPERNGKFEGERGIGLRILGDIMQAAPETFVPMCEERVKRMAEAMGEKN